MNAPAKQRRTWRSLLIPAALGFAVLLGLGTWQVERKAWKERLIAVMTARLAEAPVALPPSGTWLSLDQADDEFRHVKFSAQFEIANEALVFSSGSAFRPDVSGAGFWIFTPARLADGKLVVVNRGFAPSSEAKTLSSGQNSGPVEITGVLRWPETPQWYTPKADTAQNMWFLRDPAAIAAAKDWGAVAPFYVEQETPVPPGGWPQPGKVVASLPNNHLQYAATWYGLALVLAAVFTIWAIKAGRDAGRPGPRRPTEGASPSL